MKNLNMGFLSSKYFAKKWKFIVQNRDVAKGGPGRAQAHPNAGCALPMKIERLIYSNRTVKYFIKAVNGPDCALPTRNSGYASGTK